MVSGECANGKPTFCALSLRSAEVIGEEFRHGTNQDEVHSLVILTLPIVTTRVTGLGHRVGPPQRGRRTTPIRSTEL